MEERIIESGDATVLAQVNENIEAASGNVVLYLTFGLGRELFGIHVSEIREVIVYKQVFKVPRVSDCVKGVINLRGEVVPIIDLHARFYNTSSTISGSTAIVIVEVNDDDHKIPVGVIIDSVKAVTEINKNNIEAVSEIGNKIRTDFIEGIGKLEEKFIILLQVQNILNIEELSNVDINTK